MPAPGRLSGTYYYRVRGHNQWGYGVYSNIESVTVPPFLVADTHLEVGQCTMLSWDFTGIKKLNIRYGYGYAKVGAMAGVLARFAPASLPSTRRL